MIEISIRHKASEERFIQATISDSRSIRTTDFLSKDFYLPFKKERQNEGTSIFLRAALFFNSFQWAQNLLAQDSTQTKWTTTGPPGTARMSNSATLLPNGKVLIAGGYSGYDELGRVELYDPATGVFTDTSELSPARTDQTATLLQDGKVLVVGGQLHGSTLTSLKLYDFKTGSWTDAGNLHTARSYHTATLLPNGQVLITGGTRNASLPYYSPGVPPTALSTARKFTIRRREDVPLPVAFTLPVITIPRSC